MQESGMSLSNLWLNVTLFGCTQNNDATIKPSDFIIEQLLDIVHHFGAKIWYYNDKLGEVSGTKVRCDGTIGYKYHMTTS